MRDYENEVIETPRRKRGAAAVIYDININININMYRMYVFLINKALHVCKLYL